jgi:hypothetical protein
MATYQTASVDRVVVFSGAPSVGAGARLTILTATNSSNVVTRVQGIFSGGLSFGYTNNPGAGFASAANAYWMANMIAVNTRISSTQYNGAGAPSNVANFGGFSATGATHAYFDFIVPPNFSLMFENTGVVAATARYHFVRIETTIG